MGICEVLIPLTNSPSSEVQGNSAAALGNLSSKGLFSYDSISMTQQQKKFTSFWFALQMAGQPPMIIPLSTMCGTSRMVECTNICSAS
jgi:hypothetical protein